MNEALLKKLEEIAGSPREANGELVFPKCPFCGDTKGHFYVEAATGRYHCFKCNAGGGPYSLAKHLGVAVAPKTVSSTQEIKETATNLFRSYLLEDNISAREAREWLGKRGIPPNLLKGFTVGERKITRFLPIGLHPGDSRLIEDLQKQGYTQEEINQAGVLLRTRFRGWAGGLVFMYYVTPTNVGRFKIRKVGQPANTAVWLPGDNPGVFGLNLGDWQSKEATVVEGEFDALLLQTYSITNTGATTTVVALSGGGAGPATETLIKNGIKTIYIFPDRDEGGMNFILNIAKVARKHQTMIYVLSLPPGDWKDPADWVNAGAPRREAIYAQKETLGEALGGLLLKYRLTKDTEESHHIIVDLVRKWQLDPFDRQHLVAKVAPALQVDNDLLDEELRKISADILGWDVEIKGVKRRLGDSVDFIFLTDIGDITVPADKLLTPQVFRQKAVELNKFLPKPKQKDWDAWINQMLQTAETIEADPDVTLTGELENILVEHFHIAADDEPNRIMTEAIIKDGEYLISWKTVKNALKAEFGPQIENQKIADALKKLGGTPKQKRIFKGQPAMRVWAFDQGTWDAKYEEGVEVPIPF